MAGDIYYGKRVLGLHGTSLTDNSPTPKTVTYNGNATSSSLQQKFAGSNTFKFDGTTDYLSIPDHSDFNFAAQDFTISAWVYLNSIPGENKIIIQQTNADSTADIGPRLYVVATTMSIAFAYTVDGVTQITATSTSTITAGAWYHIAFTRSGNTGRFFIGGILDASTVSFAGAVLFNSTSVVTVGARSDGLRCLDGYIADLLEYNGVALYTSSFTVPSSPFEDVVNSAITYENEIARDAPTARWGLGDASGTSAVATVGKIASGTYSGGAGSGYTLLQSNIAYRANDKATKFQAANNGYVDIPNRTLIDFISGSPEFTVEVVAMWTTAPSVSSQTLCIFRRAYNAGESWNTLCEIQWNPTPYIGCTVCADTANTYASSQFTITPQAGIKYHLAAVLSGTGTAKTVTMYVNGVAATSGTFTSAGAPVVAGTFGTAVRDIIAANEAGAYFNGTIDDVIVYKSALSGARILAHYNAMLCRDLTFNKQIHKPKMSIQKPINKLGI
jgi:hypothetical protein